MMKPVNMDEQNEKEDTQRKPSFFPEEHQKVERMKPYINQIIKDMKTHTRSFEL